jgi:hypothetical protein
VIVVRYDRTRMALLASRVVRAMKGITRLTDGSIVTVDGVPVIRGPNDVVSWMAAAS